MSASIAYGIMAVLLTLGGVLVLAFGFYALVELWDDWREAVARKRRCFEVVPLAEPEPRNPWRGSCCNRCGKDVPMDETAFVELTPDGIRVLHLPCRDAEIAEQAEGGTWGRA